MQPSLRRTGSIIAASVVQKIDCACRKWVDNYSPYCVCIVVLQTVRKSLPRSCLHNSCMA